MDFDVARYLSSTQPDSERTPVATVVEYVMAFQKWSRDCHHLAKLHRNDIDAFQAGPARGMLDQIQKKYCSSKNRQYERGVGYFFYGGTNDVYLSISSQESVNDQLFSVITDKRKRPHSPAFRFTLEKRARVWLIASLERLDGQQKWVPDRL